MKLPNARSIQNSALKMSRLAHHSSRVTFFLMLTAFCSLLTIHAQQEKPKDLVPPPLALISDAEKENLEAESDMKKRTQLALVLMDARVKKAEELSAQKKFEESLNELGAFQALISNTLKFLNRNNSGSRKVLNNYKRFEISLRDYFPRLELMRREMPIKYGYHVRTLMKFVRDARTSATDPIFGETVLPDSDEN